MLRTFVNELTANLFGELWVCPDDLFLGATDFTIQQLTLWNQTIQVPVLKQLVWGNSIGHLMLWFLHLRAKNKLRPALHGYCEQWMAYNTKPVRWGKEEALCNIKAKDSHATVLVLTHYICNRAGHGSSMPDTVQSHEIIPCHLSRQLFTPILHIGGSKNV